MRRSVIVTAVHIHIVDMHIDDGRVAIRAIRMRMMEIVAVMPIVVVCPAVERMPPSWPEIPVERRMPANPSRSPEPIVDNRTIDIYRLNHIVSAIDILVTNHLNRHILFLVFFDIDGSHILVDVFCQHGLQHDQVAVAISGLDDAQVIDVTIAIEVEVGDVRRFVVEFLFKLLQVFCFAKQSGYRAQVEIGRDVAVGG